MTAGLYGCGKQNDRTDVAKEIRAATQRIKTGDLSDVERILTEQLYTLHAATSHYANIINTTQDPAAENIGLRGLTQCSRATRQIASAIAHMKQPKRFTIIEKQQNLMVNGAAPPNPKELGEATNAQVDTSSQRTPATVNTAAATLET